MENRRKLFRKWIFICFGFFVMFVNYWNIVSSIPPIIGCGIFRCQQVNLIILHYFCNGGSFDGRSGSVSGFTAVYRKRKSRRPV